MGHRPLIITQNSEIVKKGRLSVGRGTLRFTDPNGRNPPTEENKNKLSGKSGEQE